MKKKKNLAGKRSSVTKDKLSLKAGMPPGTIIHVGKKYAADVSLSAVFYNAETVEQKELKNIKECADLLKRNGITWINLVGISNTQVIEDIGKQFNLHPLVMEDIANTEQRPKFEEFDDYIFFTLKNLEYDKSLKEVSYEQISIVFSKDYVISFQEKKSDLFKVIKERILSGISRARTRSADYLVYLLIDSSVDSYYDVTENIEDNIESVEDEVLTVATKNSLVEIQKVKRDLVLLLKSVFPLREAINKLQRSENKLISDATHIFFNSIYDHTVHIIESVESQRDILSGLMDIYLTNINNRMNSVMKVLTVIATIFMPISFFASVYGMNFKYLPELEWPYGYVFFWAVCLTSISIMLVLFRKKKWL
jgi:magnesium transporter